MPETQLNPALKMLIDEHVGPHAQLLPNKQGRLLYFNPAEPFVPGGHGDIRRVYDPTKGKDGSFFALKMARPGGDAEEAALRNREIQGEYDNALRFNHPHIVRADSSITVLDRQRIDGEDVVEERAGILYEWMVGQAGTISIERILPTLSLEQKLTGLGQITGALDYMHKKKKTFHFDFQIGNVWLAEPGVWKVGDLGTTTKMNADIARLSQRSIQAWVMAMSPERAQWALEDIKGVSDLAARKSLPPQAEVYSLGIIAYQVLTNGRTPFQLSDIDRQSHPALIHWQRVRERWNKLATNEYKTYLEEQEYEALFRSPDLKRPTEYELQVHKIIKAEFVGSEDAFMLVEQVVDTLVSNGENAGTARTKAEQVVQVFAKVLHKDPNQRYASASEFYTALRAILSR